MNPGSRADERSVFRPHPIARDVSRRVARLPLEYFVCRSAELWVVVGPTGVFVVGQSEGDPAVAADEVVSLAHRIRSELSEAIPWTPFVDALLVADEDVRVPCTVIGLGSLEMALLSGPALIDDIGLAQLREHVPLVLTAIGEPFEVVAPTRRAAARPLGHP